jgi:transcription elongation factor/antiterminator RfaH
MNTEMNAKHPSWYVIHTNPRQEDRADSNLRGWNVETFAPRMRQPRFNQYTGGSNYITKPLFAGYIFARFELEELFHKVRFTRGVHSLVGFGEGPVAIDDEVISFMQSRVGKDGFVKIGDDLQPGDPVVVKEGLLKNLTGIFERDVKESERVMVLLDLVSYQAHVELERKVLKKFSHAAGVA